MADPNRIDILLESLATCLCAQIAEDGSPEPCFCGVMAGDHIIPSFSICQEKNGMAWVRLTSAYPASGVGIQNQTAKNCGSELGIEVEIGIMREMPYGSDTGEPPTPEEFLAASRLQTADMFSMIRAVNCCDAIEDYILSTYTPHGPRGLSIGGTFTVMLLT